MEPPEVKNTNEWGGLSSRFPVASPGRRFFVSLLLYKPHGILDTWQDCCHGNTDVHTQFSSSLGSWKKRLDCLCVADVGMQALEAKRLARSDDEPHEEELGGVRWCPGHATLSWGWNRWQMFSVWVWLGRDSPLGRHQVIMHKFKVGTGDTATWKAL